MVIRKIFFAWFVVTAVCTVISFFSYNGSDNNKWFGAISTMALLLAALPLLFLITLLYHRLFKTNRTGLNSLSTDDESKPAE